MKIRYFGWKNFLQRTVMFFIMFVCVKLFIDMIDNSFTLANFFSLEWLKYLGYSLILGLADTYTWRPRTEEESWEEEPIQHKSIWEALRYYGGVAFFVFVISLLISAVIGGIAILILKFGLGKSFDEPLPWAKLLITLASIAILFAVFDAIKNLIKLRRRK